MCAQVATTWVLIDQATGRPRRVQPWMLEMFS
jgi:acyl-CoA thioester hydrolase